MSQKIREDQISRMWYYIFSTTGVNDQLENIFLQGY